MAVSWMLVVTSSFFLAFAGALVTLIFEGSSVENQVAG
jgi:hypothetical protein